MLIRKTRQKSRLLVGLQLLDKRMDLSHEDKMFLYKLEKGLEGEERFDSIVKTYLTKEVIVLNDLLLTVNGTTIQIDALMITAEGVNIYEVKNYKGNYQLQSGRFLAMNGQEISNPLSQLNKSLIKLRQLFTEWGIEEPVEGRVLFVEPSFYLYNSILSDPFVFPTQLDTYFASFNKKMTRLTQSHHYLSDKLMQAVQVETAYEKQLPVFDFRQLKKGMSCQWCGSFSATINQRTFTCNICRSKTSLESAVISNIKELTFLFPDTKLTTSLVYDWCGRAIVFKRIRQILLKNYSIKGRARGTYFI